MIDTHIQNLSLLITMSLSEFLTTMSLSCTHTACWLRHLGIHHMGVLNRGYFRRQWDLLVIFNNWMTSVCNEFLNLSNVFSTFNTEQSAQNFEATGNSIEICRMTFGLNDQAHTEPPRLLKMNHAVETFCRTWPNKKFHLAIQLLSYTKKTWLDYSLQGLCT